MRVLVFGDSITQGFWDIDGGWVERLRRYYDELQVQDLKHNDEPTIFNLGISADNSANLLSRVKAETAARIKPRHKGAVVIQIGVNDSSLSHESFDVSVDMNAFRNNLVGIIKELKDFSARIIFVGSSACDESKTVPVFWNNIDYTNQQIKTYEVCMMQVAKEKEIAFMPIFDQFKAKLDSGQDLLADGLHPNSAGHQLIFDLVKPELDKLLRT